MKPHPLKMLGFLGITAMILCTVPVCPGATDDTVEERPFRAASEGKKRRALAPAPAVDNTWMQHVSAEDRARTNPYLSQPDAIAAGSKLFSDHCAKCHGAPRTETHSQYQRENQRANPYEARENQRENDRENAN
jgi:Cytochrome c